MGGRGANSGSIVKSMTDEAMNYVPYAKGQISKFEAGVIYKAFKNGDVEVLPETISRLYNDTKDYIRFASDRYSQDYLYYDRIYGATKSILNKDFKDAQENLKDWEEDMIKYATKKSSFYKYQKQEVEM